MGGRRVEEARRGRAIRQVSRKKRREGKGRDKGGREERRKGRRREGS